MNAGNKKRKVSNADVIAEDKKRRRKNIQLAQDAAKCAVIVRAPEIAPPKPVEEKQVEPETVKSTPPSSDISDDDTPPSFETNCQDTTAVPYLVPSDS